MEGEGKGAALVLSCLAHRRRNRICFAHNRSGLGGCSRCLTQLLKELVLGLLHAPCSFGVAHESGEGLQSGQGEAGAQIWLGLVQRQERFQRGLIATVAAAFSSLRVHLHVGLCTRTVIVQIRVQVRAVELPDAVGMGGRDMAQPIGLRMMFPPAHYRWSVGADFWSAGSSAGSAVGPRFD